MVDVKNVLEEIPASQVEAETKQEDTTTWKDYVQPLPILNPQRSQSLVSTLYVYIPQEQTTYKFFGDFSYDKDAEDCMGTGTLKMPYHNTLWAFWEPGFQELEIKGGVFDYSTMFKGRTRGIKQDGQFIEIALQDCGWRLKQQYEGDAPSGSVAEAFKMLVKKAGMIPVISGLKEDYQIKTDESTTGTISGSATGGTTGTYNIGSGSSIPTGKSGGDTDKPYNGEGVCDTSLTSAVRGQAYLINDCAGNYDQDTKKHDWGPWVNWCPACGGVGTLTTAEDLPGIMGIVCINGNCDVDHSCVHGYGTSVMIGGVEYGNAANGSGSLRCKNQLIGCGNNPYNNKGMSAGGSSGGSGQEAEDDEKTYEELIQGICEGNDLIFYTDFNNQCILYDYPSLMEEIDKNCFQIENWMMQYPSFTLDVNQFGFYNTVEINYSGGVVKESYEDLVAIYGEVVKKYDEPDKDKIGATLAAKSRLATLLRDFAMEIQMTTLHSGAMMPGTFCSAENPITHVRETYFISGINVTQTPTEAPKSSLVLLYAPSNPESPKIPEIAGPTATDEDVKPTGPADTSSVEALAKSLGTPKACWTWIHENVEYEMYTNKKYTDMQVINGRRANCVDGNRLLSEMFKVLKYPTGGVKCGYSCLPWSSSHCITDITINGQKIDVDWLPDCQLNKL